MKFIEFFETNSNKSMTRLVFFIDIITCSIISILAIICDSNLVGTAALIGALIVPLSAAKAIQSKFEEEK